MPVRMRPVRWDLLVNPSMAAANITARSGEFVGSMLLGAGQAIGGGLARRRQEAESARRFDTEQLRLLAGEERMAAQGRRSADLSMLGALLEVEKMNERARDRQASETSALDGLEVVVDQANAEGQATGTVRPQITTLLERLTQSLGGQEAAGQKFIQRASGNIRGGPT